MCRRDLLRNVRYLIRLSLLAALGAATGCGSGGGSGDPRDVPAPTLASIAPATGFTPGGSTATLRGAGFLADEAGPNTVTLGGMAATNVVAVDDTTLTCTLPAGGLGPADVEISNANGAATLSDGVTYYSFPPNFPATDTRVHPDDPASQGAGAPRICCDGANVYVAWFEYRDLGLDIYFSRSGDGGATWQAAPTRLDTDAPGAATSSQPTICCAGSSVYVAWTESRNGSRDIYFNRSVDGGATWQAADTRLDTDASDAATSQHPRICCNGSNVYVCWADNRNGRWDVYFTASTDGGATWPAADTRLDTDAPGAADSDTVEMCCDGANVYVTWEEARNGRDDIYFNSSVDGGGTWQAADVRLDTDAPGAERSNGPSIGCDGSKVHVTWKDSRNGTDDIYLNSSGDGGLTWKAADVRIDTSASGTADASSPQICCDGANVYVTWQDERNSVADVYFNRSTDDGATWMAADVRLDADDPVAAESFSPQICCDGTSVYVTWNDDRNGLRDIYFTASADGGATWQAAEKRLDTDGPGTAQSNGPQICCDGANAFVTWVDGRDAGKESIYYTASQP